MGLEGAADDVGMVGPLGFCLCSLESRLLSLISFRRRLSQCRWSISSLSTCSDDRVPSSQFLTLEVIRFGTIVREPRILAKSR